MKLLSTISWSSLATAIRLANGFIAMKVVAVIIGPIGMALIGQLSNFNTIVMTLALGGITSGVIKYTSQFKDNPNELYKVWHTITWVSGILMIPIIILLLVLHTYLSNEFLHDSKYSSIFVILAFSLVFYVANNLLLNVLNGLHEIRQYNLFNILNSVIGLLFTICLVYKYKIYGALLALVTSQSVTFFIMIILVYNNKWFKLSNFFGGFDRTYFKKLLGYTVMSLTSICVVPTSQMFVRGYLAEHTSWDVAGYWQGMQRISDSYLLIVYTALGTYFLPKLASLETREQIGLEIRHGYKYVMPFVIGSALAIYFLRDFIINLLFARTFSPMKGMFFYQLLGDIFKIASYLIAYLMLAKAKTRIYIITEIFFGISFAILSFILINLIGGNGPVLAFAINYFLYFMMFVILYKKGVLF